MSEVPVRTAERLLRHAAEQALLAPSIHNSQPWTFWVTDNRLDLLADTGRRLTVLDPRLRQLTISCGCALFTARVSLAADGVEPRVERLPDPTHPELLARVSVGPPRGGRRIAGLAPYIGVRRTNRRGFLDREVPLEVIDELTSVAAAEHVQLLPVADPLQRQVTAHLFELAEQIENLDPSYRAELAAWTTDDPRRPDGVQAATIPYHGPAADAAADELPLRSFDTTGMGWLPPTSDSSSDQCLLLFATSGDEPRDWLGVGEALQHVWLELTRLGYSASPLTQVVEVRQTNRRLRQELELDAYPQLLLRVGRAPAAVRTPRRDPADVIRTPTSR